MESFCYDLKKRSQKSDEAKKREKIDPFAFFEVKKELPVRLTILIKQGRNISKGEKSTDGCPADGRVPRYTLVL